MKQTSINQLRNFFHVFIMFTFMYMIGSICEFDTFTLDSKIVGVPLGGIIIGGVFGGFWEYIQSTVMGSVFDLRDVVRTACGGLLGAVLTIFYPSFGLITTYFFIVSLGLIVAEIIRCGRILYRQK